MDVSLGKSLDAWFGRLIDFIGADPLRREVRLKLDAKPAPPPRVEVPEQAAPEKRAQAAAEPKRAAPRKQAAPKKQAAPRKAAAKPKRAAPKKSVVKPKKAAPRKRAVKPRPVAVALEEAVRRAEQPPPRPAGIEAADRQVLETLAAFADGAAINELAAAIGQPAAALRRRLDKLAAAGRVERVAAGLRTRFRRTGE